MTLRAVVAALVLVLPAPASADRIFTAFLGAVPDAESGFLDLAQTLGQTKPAWGVSVGTINNVFGWELDASAAPGFFSGKGDRPQLVSGSQASTLMLNAVFTTPRGWIGATVRPYGVVGAGFVKVRIDDVSGLFSTDTLLRGMDIGGGVIALPWRRLGLRADVRYVRSQRKEEPEATLGFGPAFLDLWRISTGAVLRF